MEENENVTRLHENLINFERSILSSIIFEPETLIDVSDRLKPHQFYYAPYQTIYEAILTIYRSDRPIDESFIDQELKGKYRKELGDILAANPIANTFPYITEVVEQYRRREMRKLAMEIMKANEAEKSSDSIIGEIEGFIANIDEGDEDMGQSFTQLKDEYSRSPASPVYSTGVSFIDESLNGGFEMGQFVLMSGDPEAGKTVLTLQILKNVSEYAPAIMFAFEFTTRSLVKMQLKTEGDKYVNDNLILIDKGYDISDIERKIKKWTRKGAKFFVIDSQMRIENANNTKGTMEERESEKFSRLAKLAHSQEILIILIIQNSKADTSASVISPMGSKKGAHEASIIMHLKRLKDDEKEGGEKEMRELIMSKNKQTGQHYKGKINFNPYTLKFTRPYGHSGSVEYEGHKKKGNIPVEHQNANGQKTGSSSMTLGTGLMLDEDNDEKINMAVI